MFYFIIIVLALALMTQVIKSSELMPETEAALHDRGSKMLEHSVASLTEAVKNHQFDNFEYEWECVLESGVCNGNYQRVVTSEGYVNKDNWEQELYPDYLQPLKLPLGWQASVRDRTDEVSVCFWSKYSLESIAVARRFYERMKKNLVSVGDTGCDTTSPMSSTSIDTLGGVDLFLNYQLINKGT